MNDGGWCQATHESIVAAMKELGIPEENLIVLESIDDTDQATTQTAAEELINEGCTLIFGASTGYASYLPEIAAAHPEVLFAQWGNKVDGLIDSGIKYMGMEASSPAIPETCEKNDAFVVGYHNDMSSLAPKAVLVSHIWNFAPIFKNIMINAAEGTATANDFYYWGGECSMLSEFADFVPEEIISEVSALKDKIASWEVKVFAGELKDNAGNVLVP